MRRREEELEALDVIEEVHPELAKGPHPTADFPRRAAPSTSQSNG